MADRLTVTLPLVWRGGEWRMALMVGPFEAAVVEKYMDGRGYWALSRIAHIKPMRTFKTLAAAMRAVEQAVMRALRAEPSATGAEGGGDE